MFIQTEPTPNPTALKFLPGREVVGSGSADFPTADRAERSPLARRLFGIGGVTGVFLGADFVTVSKADDAEWTVLRPLVMGAIMDHYTAGDPVLLDGGDSVETGEESAVVTQIRELIDTRVRPAVAQDGGDIIFRGFTDGVVYLHLQGSCSGCPSSTATLKHGIENMLRYYVPEVQAVQAVE